MARAKGFWHGVAIVVGMTMGAGVFALPAVFAASGWLTGLLYLILLGGIVVFVHTIYWQLLRRVDGEHRLLGLCEMYFGRPGFYSALLIMTSGLFLALVAYLALGSRFLIMMFPAIPSSLAPLIFWALSSAPLILGSRPAFVEMVGTVLMIGGIAFVFFGTPDFSPLFRIVPVDPAHLALPFGAILFALAGWPAVEPVYELWREKGSAWSGARVLAVGTAIAAALYFIFVVGIFGSTPNITDDTISGLAGWPWAKLFAMGFVGIFAIWTSYIPIGVEIRNMFEKDLGVKTKHLATAIIVLVPLALLLAGLDNFMMLVSLTGGLFLSAEYFLILAVGARALGLRSWRRTLLYLSMGAFGLAAIYELVRPAL
ncbi:MAG: aromatic amino acid transport family protein [bacterium]|nr:aromatic amino acid transport family protein [bacterium]